MRLTYFILLLLFSFSLAAQQQLEPSIENSQSVLQLKLYPNPAPGEIVNVITEANAKKQVIAYDVFGEIVLSASIAHQTLDISGLVAGVYMLRITEGQNSFTRKLVVK